MTILTTNSIGTTPKAIPVSTVQHTFVAPPPVAAKVAPVPDSSSANTTAAVKTEQQVTQAIERLKQSIKPALASSLEFEIDHSTGKTIVKIFDTETHKLVRQIPSEELRAIAEALDRMQGQSGLVEKQV